VHMSMDLECGGVAQRLQGEIAGGDSSQEQCYEAGREGARRHASASPCGRGHHPIPSITAGASCGVPQGLGSVDRDVPQSCGGRESPSGRCPSGSPTAARAHAWSVATWFVRPQFLADCGESTRAEPIACVVIVPQVGALLSPRAACEPRPEMKPRGERGASGLPFRVQPAGAPRFYLHEHPGHPHRPGPATTSVRRPFQDKTVETARRSPEPYARDRCVYVCPEPDPASIRTARLSTVLLAVRMISPGRIRTERHHAERGRKRSRGEDLVSTALPPALLLRGPSAHTVWCA